MQGNTEQMQLKLISQLCGSINPEVWPGVVKLDSYKNLELAQGQKRRASIKVEIEKFIILSDKQLELFKICIQLNSNYLRGC